MVCLGLRHLRLIFLEKERRGEELLVGDGWAQTDLAHRDVEDREREVRTRGCSNRCHEAPRGGSPALPINQEGEGRSVALSLRQ